MSSCQARFWLPHKNKFLKLSTLLQGYIYTKKGRKCLVTGEWEEFEIELFIDSLQELSPTNKNHVLLLAYEFSYFLLPGRELLQSKICDDQWLAIWLEFKNTDLVVTPEFKSTQLAPLDRERELISYTDQFSKVQKHLHHGDCYQLNLTERFSFKLGGTEKEIWPWKKREEISHFAHSLILEREKFLFLSNSPECLFQTRTYKETFQVYSMPIKGTYPEGERIPEKDPKNQAELDMITDLIRNDLSSVGKAYSKVLKRREILKVPGLQHQFSLLGVTLKKKPTLLELLRGLFPGGSITGAPKRRVMELIAEIENGPRGFYCGSTILSLGGEWEASINIRSAEVDLSRRELTYGAGGGITVLSDEFEERKEMEGKLTSFTRLFR